MLTNDQKRAFATAWFFARRNTLIESGIEKSKADLIVHKSGLATMRALGVKDMDEHLALLSWAHNEFIPLLEENEKKC